MGRSGVWGYKLILGIRMSPRGLWIGCAVRMPRCDAPRQATSFHDMRRHATTCHDMTTHDIILCVIFSQCAWWCSTCGRRSLHDMPRHATKCHDMTMHDIIICVIFSQCAWWCSTCGRQRCCDSSKRKGFHSGCESPGHCDSNGRPVYSTLGLASETGMQLHLGSGPRC